MTLVRAVKSILTKANHYLYPPRNYLSISLRLANRALEAQGAIRFDVGWHALTGMTLGVIANIADSLLITYQNSVFLEQVKLDFLEGAVLRLVQMICLESPDIQLVLSKKLANLIESKTANEAIYSGLKMVIIQHILQSSELYPQIKSLVLDVLRRKDVEAELKQAIITFFNSEYFQELLANKISGLIKNESSQEVVSRMVRNEAQAFLSKKENIAVARQYM